jgi:hypothetical protein
MKSMTVHLRGIAAALILWGLLAGCDFFTGPEASEGAVTIQLGPGSGGERSVAPAVIPTFHYELEFRGPGGKVINRSVPQGTESLNLTLALGDWTVTVTAYDPGGVQQAAGRTTVTVMQGHTPVAIPMGSSNANLSGISIKAEIAYLILNPLTLSPTFSSGGTSYTAAPAFVTLGSHFHVTATVSDPDAVITMTGGPASSGTATAMNGGPVSSGVAEEFDGLELHGQRTVRIVVTAQDGITRKTYTVTVIRTI